MHTMKSVFEGADEDDFMEVELALSMKCSSDGTMDVTSNDFRLDEAHPSICPVGTPAPSAAFRTRGPLYTSSAIELRIGSRPRSACEPCRKPCS